MLQGFTPECSHLMSASRWARVGKGPYPPDFNWFGTFSGWKGSYSASRKGPGLSP